MKIVVAPNAFKGSLSATMAATAMARGVRDAIPEAEVVQVPVADGGDGNGLWSEDTTGTASAVVPTSPLAKRRLLLVDRTHRPASPARPEQQQQRQPEHEHQSAVQVNPGEREHARLYSHLSIENRQSSCGGANDHMLNVASVQSACACAKRATP